MKKKPFQRYVSTYKGLQIYQNEKGFIHENLDMDTDHCRDFSDPYPTEAKCIEAINSEMESRLF